MVRGRFSISDEWAGRWASRSGTEVGLDGVQGLPELIDCPASGSDPTWSHGANESVDHESDARGVCEPVDHREGKRGLESCRKSGDLRCGAFRAHRGRGGSPRRGRHDLAGWAVSLHQGCLQLGNSGGGSEARRGSSRLREAGTSRGDRPGGGGFRALAFGYPDFELRLRRGRPYLSRARTHRG